MKWLSAKPLDGYSSLHQGALFSLFGRDYLHFSCVISFNLDKAPRNDLTTMTIYSHPVIESKSFNSLFTITHFVQWQMNIEHFKSFSDYLAYLNHKQRRNYFKVIEHFKKFGCKLKLENDDWSQHVDRIYELYCNVAKKYIKIYNKEFFKIIAKRSEYKLITAWHGKELIADLVYVEEGAVIHAMMGGLDYKHSKLSFAYSALHYEFISEAIRIGKYKIADAGVTADAAKHNLGFEPMPAVVEITARGIVFRMILFFANLFLNVHMNEKNEICIGFRWPRSKRFQS